MRIVSILLFSISIITIDGCRFHDSTKDKETTVETALDSIPKVNAENSSPIDSFKKSACKIYLGRISEDEKISEFGQCILMQVVIKDEVISGYSYHTSSKKKFSLEGSMNKKKVATIYELNSNGLKEGAFHLTVLPKDELIGVWKNNNQSEKLSVSFEVCKLSYKDGKEYSAADTLKPVINTESIYGVYYSTSNKPANGTGSSVASGYFGKVIVKRSKQKNAFGMSIEVINYDHGSGEIDGFAHFVTPDIGILHQDNDCAALVFVFKKDNLLVYESNCSAWHGAACQFEDWYKITE